MSFLVTGCGRSGTRFLARLFNELGVRTSHEEYFTAYTPFGAETDFMAWLAATRTAGEVSGLAAPHAVRGMRHVSQALLVRNPVAVIASLMGLKNLHPESHHLANIKHNFRHIPAMNHNDDPVRLAMTYWLEWNRLADVRVLPQLICRVEKLGEEDGRFAIEMLKKMGVDVEYTECKQVLKKLGSEYNGGARDPDIAWKTLWKGDIKDQIAAQAVGYGYTMKDLESYRPVEAKGGGTA